MDRARRVIFRLLPFGGLIALFCALPTTATIVYTMVSPDSLTVGDRIEYRVAIVAPKGATIVPPATENGFGDFVVKGWSSDKKELARSDSLTFSYILTTYTVKPCSIPSLNFVEMHEGITDTLITQVKPVRVLSVVTGDTVDIKDLKALQIAGKPSLFWVWLVMGALSVIAVLFFMRHLLARRTTIASSPPPKPAYEEALEALAALEAKQYVQKGLVREFVFEISDILKRYIERRYSVAAMEFTTEEMLEWISRASSLTKDTRLCGEWFFKATDPVKFAKYIPESSIVDRFGLEVKRFLEMTKPLPVEAAVSGEVKQTVTEAT